MNRLVRMRCGTLCTQILTAFFICAALGSPVIAGAASTSHLRVVHVDGDAFYNYDFGGKCGSTVNPSCASPPDGVSARNVDMPMNLLFWGNADVQKIANKMTKYDQSGDSMYGRVDDGAGMDWAGDPGLKTTFCSHSGSAVHFRRYRNPNKLSSYTRRWGFYVLASSHIDYHECGSGKWSGKSEDAERQIGRDAADVWGSDRVWESSMDWGNAEAYRREPHHIWQSDGHPTMIYVYDEPSAGPG